MHRAVSYLHVAACQGLPCQKEGSHLNMSPSKLKNIFSSGACIFIHSERPSCTFYGGPTDLVAELGMRVVHIGSGRG